MEFKHIKPPDFLNENKSQKLNKPTKDIQIYKTTSDFDIPVDESYHIETKPGTSLVCFENEVYVSEDGTYVKASFDKKFLDLNKNIFEKVKL